MQKNAAVFNLPYVFSWSVFCVHLKRMYILLMLGEVLYKYQFKFNSVGQILYILLSFYLFYQLLRKGWQNV